MNPIILILGLPLLGFLINGVFGSKLPKIAVGAIGTASVLGAFIIAILNWNIISQPENNSIHLDLFTFLQIDQLSLKVAFQLDRLSIWMTLIITGIGTLIHLYSISYMKEDDGFYKFFAYLNFFIFNMLLLVLGSNFLMMFFGWEGVGLCSYLLIGFWYKNEDYGKAARKAFIMNRIGDLGLLLGMFLIISQFGSLDYSVVFPQIASGNTSTSMLTAISLLLFVGATGKSAQIPLFTWLPDAMAGPTPVSALIHAATMVTAGIYLTVRCQVLFALSPLTNEIILWVGLGTAVMAALIGLKQNDIKKVLAYSTVSQLGFMFVALGTGAYSTALFHVTTHAFFKALLFLGAGSVIHGMHHEQDIRHMGGLKSKMPMTHLTFLIGTLAISGFPLLSGFFSKDEILTAVFLHNKVAYVLLAGSALLTTIYMFRLYFLTFHGQYRNHHHAFDKVHESPMNMTLPLMVLALLSIVGGALNLPTYVTHSDGFLLSWLKPLFIIPQSIHEINHSTEYILIGIAVLIFVSGFLIARNIFVSKATVPAENSTGLGGILQNKFYVDEFYNKVFVRPLEITSSVLHDLFDGLILRAFTFGIFPMLKLVGRLNKKVQNGNIEMYLLYMVIAIVLLLGVNLIFA
jgi:NADH-quinone oxidoreductase subunit L